MTRKEKIEERLRADPDDVFLNYTYAMELAKLEDLPAAQTAFARTRALDANYVSAYFQEGQLLAGQGEVAAAREILQAGIVVAKKIGDSHALGEMTDFLDNL
ncbi:tetratricopeptide repeat protein [Planctomicrobium piriforme]|uniref:Tetratricopeptide repeat-containing protein n=1 Tax=Planctomicrobium piriforme TaxID=1576369 RepID=A0A1I3S6A7_9PLAN|nr:hypothetical protein [Planctomicrobium piriforme]SFJ54235.1 hypothetical protein SAMN05421753_12334 [Planctomicrobium piriforme]